jgi:hypothetical protein
VRATSPPYPTIRRDLMATSKEVAYWMLAQLEANDELLQVEAVAEIQRRFGPEFVYVGSYGEMSIAARVLYQFRELSGDSIVWVTEHGGVFSPGAHWRKRGAGDSPGRTQYQS